MTDTATPLDPVSLGGPETPPAPEGASAEVREIVETLYGDGIIGKKGAFSREWTVRMAEDVHKAFHEALARPCGAIGRQPWHRDFRMPDETKAGKRLTSLAFDPTAVDTVEEMGPFETCAGHAMRLVTRARHEMFPPRSMWSRHEERAVRTYPRMGDMSARSPLTIHHHLVCPVVDELTPITQKHDIEGLMMGEP